MTIFKLVESNFLTRYPCHICNGSTEKVPILCEAPGRFRICETCLKHRNFDECLHTHIKELESFIANLRALVGQIDAPTFETYEKMVKEEEEKFLESLSPEERAALTCVGEQEMPCSNLEPEDIPF